jgi:simple sugar transport system permease protein
MPNSQPLGFDGISVALIANTQPLLCIPSAMFMQYLRTGASMLQSAGYRKEIANIIISIIIYCLAIGGAIGIYYDRIIAYFKAKKKTKLTTKEDK